MSETKPNNNPTVVIPAKARDCHASAGWHPELVPVKAGKQVLIATFIKNIERKLLYKAWIPACAGMTITDPCWNDNHKKSGFGSLSSNLQLNPTP